MTRGPGRHSERNFRAAEQHYNAAEYYILLLLLLLLSLFNARNIYNDRRHKKRFLELVDRFLV